MIALNPFMEKAMKSRWGLWQLNQILWRVVPFNAPHRLKVVQVEHEALSIELPYIRKNRNHIQGLHACALATLSEYVCGLHLLKILGAGNYRIILKSLKMDYHFQGKESVQARFELNTEIFMAELEEKLKIEESILRVFKIEIFDSSKRLISTAFPEWQIKPWSKVKTQI
jgi:acyl-coenzyme A thioesterase PaaI-like protein